MALNPYDADLHHIGLRASGGADYGFMLQGGYTKEIQREVGGGNEFGGSQDLIAPGQGLSRWTQDDFVGGQYQYDWGKDDAMFARCRNMIPSQMNRSMRTIAPMYWASAYDGGGTPVAAFARNGSLYFVFPDHIARYRHDTDSWSTASFGIAGAGYEYADGDLDNNEDMIYLLGNVPFGGAAIPSLYRLNPDLTQPTQTTYYPDATVAGRVGRGLAVTDQLLIVGLGQFIYTADPPEDKTDVALNATWTKIARMPGHWIDSASYNGLTYILSASSDFKSYLYAFDGTALLPVCVFPFNFRATAMAVYGGRVFVAGAGTDLSGSDVYGELYEVTGSSVRLVRTFEPESQRSNGPEYPTTITSLVVAEGLLWFWIKDVGLMAYDLTSDGFFGASQTQQSAGSEVYKLLVGRGKLYGFLHHDSDTSKDGIYRVASEGDAVSAYDGELDTSDFQYEPGRDKRWSEIKVLARYAAPGCDYSVDGGVTWTNLTVSVDNDGDHYVATASLAGVPVSPRIRFRFYLPRATDVTGFAELVAYTVSFAFLETGKRVWRITLNGATDIEGVDGSSISQDVNAMDTTLWDWAVNKTRLVLTDLDNTEANVSIIGFGEASPIIGEQTGAPKRPEAFYTLNLMEV